MSEVKRYHVTEAGLVEGQALGRINVVLAADYDGAVQCFLTAAEGCVSAERRERALQQRLTAADERAVVLEGLVGEVLDAVGREPLDLDAVLRLRARMRAALKPAEGGGDETRQEAVERHFGHFGDGE